MSNPNLFCPKCNKKLYDEVPDSLRKLYNLEFWDRRIGIFNVDQKKKDGWICPYCCNKLN